MSFMLGCTAKSFTPAGVPPIGAVSPLGLPCGFGIGALIDESNDQSLVLVTAIVESSDADINLDLVGKHNAVTDDA